MRILVDRAIRSARSDASDTPLWEGRAFGGIVLAAFLLYGIGSAIADRPTGLALVVINSMAVALAGWIGYRVVRSFDRNVGSGYLMSVCRDLRP